MPLSSITLLYHCHSLEPLVRNPAMLEAMRIYRALWAVNNGDIAFEDGQCLMTLRGSEIFKV